MEKYNGDSLALYLTFLISLLVPGSSSWIKRTRRYAHVLTTTWLNNKTIKNKFPLLLIDPSFEPLCHAQILTKLDLFNAYHLVCIQEGDELKTALNTPAVYQVLFKSTLHDMLNYFLFVTSNFLTHNREHTKYVCLVLQKLLSNQKSVSSTPHCQFPGICDPAETTLTRLL